MSATRQVLELLRSDFEAVQSKRIEELQQACSHAHVVHYGGFESFGTYHPIRVCMDCGFEETGGWWCYSVDTTCWHPKDSYKPGVLRNQDGREIIEVRQQHEVLKYRLD